MRVISGSAKGMRLGALDGLETRPTTDRVKETVFNIIQFELEGRAVLDLFAGTGQLGIEALSRGAQGAVFVERRDDAVRLIRENLKKTGFSDRAQVFKGEAADFVAGCRERFGVIFLDPPYRGSLLAESLAAISEFDILTDGGIILCERPGDSRLEVPEGFGCRDYRCGKTVISLLRRTRGETV